MVDIGGPGAATVLANVGVAGVGVAVGLARGGLERPAARAFTAWMFFRGLVATALFFSAQSTTFLLAFRLYPYFTIGMDVAFAAFALTWLAKPNRLAIGAILVAGVLVEAVYFFDHCAVFCFQEPARLTAGPFGWIEIFLLLYPAAAWLFASRIRDARAQRAQLVMATALLLLGAFYATNGVIQWAFLGAASAYVPGPWLWLLVLTQCSPMLAVVPAAIALSRKLAPRARVVLGIATLAALALGAWQNVMPAVAANLVASLVTAFVYAVAVWAFATTREGAAAQKPALDAPTALA